MPAARQYWSAVQPLPAAHAPVTLPRAYTPEEYERIRQGFVPERMEDKWFIFLEGDTLFLHRSWTGHCIFQVRFARQGDAYTASEAFANRDPSQYPGANDLDDGKLLAYLIGHLLLGESHPLPMGSGVPAGLATALHHHHVIGAGYRPQPQTARPTLGSVLKWLWQWLVTLVRR